MAYWSDCECKFCGKPITTIVCDAGDGNKFHEVYCNDCKNNTVIEDHTKTTDERLSELERRVEELENNRDSGRNMMFSTE